MTGSPRVLVTRSREGASELVPLLDERGLHAVTVPTLAFRPMPVPGLGALLRGRPFHVLVFTSANAVRYLADAIRELGAQPSDLPALTVAVIGPATAEAARSAGYTVRIVPPHAVAEQLLAALLDHGVSGRRILFPRAKRVREVIVPQLRRMGATVRELPVYETVAPDSSRHLLAQMDSLPELVTAASSATLRNLEALLPADRRAAWHGVPLVTIGPITTGTARDLGWADITEAREASLTALADACRARLALGRPG